MTLFNKFINEDILPCLSSYGNQSHFVVKLLNRCYQTHFASKIMVLAHHHIAICMKVRHNTVSTSENDLKIQSTPESPSKLRKLMSNMTISVTSLPDNFLITRERTKKASSNCSLCSTPAVKFRFQLQPNTTWYSICNSCRKCLVASANFFSFIRNIKSSLFGPRIKPMIELYLESAQYRRACFYARSGGADQFFVFSDFLQFQRLQKINIWRIRVPSIFQNPSLHSTIATKSMNDRMITSQQIEDDEIFTCFICYGPLTDTVIFPCCSKYSCLLCISVNMNFIFRTGLWSPINKHVPIVVHH